MHLVSSPSLIIALCIIVAAVSLVRFRHFARLGCEQLVRMLRPHLLAGMDRYLGDASRPDELFFRAIGGSACLRGMWINRAVLVRLCQLHLMQSPEAQQRDLETVLAISAELARANLVALIAATFRHWLPEWSDATAFRTFRLYNRLANETYFLATDSPTPLCGRMLSALL